MPVMVKKKGIWTKLVDVFVKVGGVWKKPKIFVKTDGVWKSLSATTSMIVTSSGWGSMNANPPGVTFNKSYRVAGFRSYTVAQLSGLGELLWSQSYDVYADVNQAAAMAAKLNSIPKGHIVVIFSTDEPQTNRLSSGLKEAMVRLGAGAYFTGNTMKYQGAYILFSFVGGMAWEWYSDTWVSMQIDLAAGEIVGFKNLN